MPPRPKFTIAHLMIVVALFGVLFALPVGLSTILGGLILSGVISWGGVVTLWRFFGWKSFTGRAAEDVAALAIVALGLDVASWFLYFLLMTVSSNNSVRTLIVVTLLVAVAMLGTLAFVTALTALLGPGEGRSAGMNLVAFFAAITSFPFQFGLGFGLVLIVISPFH